MARKKYKLKPDVYLYLIVIIVIIVMCSKGIKAYKNHKYEQTLEYKLIEKGYSKSDIKLLSKYYTEKELIGFTTRKYDKNLLTLLKNEKYIKGNHDEYLAYIDLNPNQSIDEAINTVNLHLNYNHYENPIPADTSKGFLILVNKYYYLDETYEPADLDVISTKYSWGSAGSQKLRADALNAFIQMHADAEAAGIYLMVNRSYRSYEAQKALYDNYKNGHGEKEADAYTPRPGFSERQTGLAVDILSLQDSLQSTFKDSATYTWLKDNSYKYGFILRFPEGKEKITGFESEPWHYRYVGVDAAKYIYENQITLEEYYVYHMNK